MVTLPPGDWVTVDEAMALVPNVSRRRIQALARPVKGRTPRVHSVMVLGRLLLDRGQLVAWRDSRDMKGGRPRKSPPPGP